MSFPQDIMIVENEKTIQCFITDVLRQNQVKNIECYDTAKDALDRMQSKFFDIVLMDIHINGTMNGIDLARRILQITDLPIVFISGDIDTEILDNVLKISPYGFIFKPFTSKDIEFSLQLAYRNYSVQMQQCRKRKALISNNIVFIDDKYYYDMSTKKLYRDNASVKLNLRQERAIEIICRNMNNTVTYEVLSYAIWGESKNKGSVLRTLIYTIRKLLPDLPIVSYSKIGYSLQTKE